MSLRTRPHGRGASRLYIFPIAIMNIIFIESFYGGSHKNFLDGLVKYSSHDIVPFTLPARFWKWRLRSSALYFAEQCHKKLDDFDLLIATDMLNLAELKALTHWEKPMILFFHENQLTYPTPNLRYNMDPGFGLINIASALTADLNLFNSRFQMEQFQSELPDFINRIPEFIPEQAKDAIVEKSKVVYMGCDFSHFTHLTIPQNEEPVILWNHRWEFDKQPAVFFRALYALAEENIPFKVILLGENYQVHPREFLEAREKLGDRIIRFGFVESPDDYTGYLQMADIVVSTAVQENFGFSVTEAMYSYTLPLLPNRLSYPEILDEEFHDTCLYKNDDELVEKLRYFLQHYREYDTLREQISKSMQKYDWHARIVEFDQLFEKVAARK